MSASKIEALKKWSKTITENFGTISFLAYGTGLILQVMILASIAGFYGISYLSFQFSLVLFALVVLLILISIPVWIATILILFVMSFHGVWSLYGWVGKAFVICAILTLIFAWFFRNEIIACLPEKWKRKDSENPADKILQLYFKTGMILFVTIVASLFFTVLSPQAARVKTENMGVLVGRYLFFNQDYYFLNICGENLILPAKQVQGINIMLTSMEMMETSNKKKLAELENKYGKYCQGKFSELLKE